MFIELTDYNVDIKFLLNTHSIQQVLKNGEQGCLIYIQNDNAGPYCVTEPYEYFRNILLSR